MPEENNVVEVGVSNEEFEQMVNSETESTGLTKKQKVAGLGIIGLALTGVAWLILLAIKGVKAIIGKIKGKKEAEPEKKDEIVPDDDFEDFVDDGPLDEEPEEVKAKK